MNTSYKPITNEDFNLEIKNQQRNIDEQYNTIKKNHGKKEI